jgi:hypothetical protein
VNFATRKKCCFLPFQKVKRTFPLTNQLNRAMKKLLVTTSAFAVLALSSFVLLDGMLAVSITCKHCTRQYEIKIPEEGVGSKSYQHSISGCNKYTKVYWNHGKITKTE